MKRIFLVLLILVAIGGVAFSFDIHSFPSPIEKNDIMISPTFSFGSYYGWESVIAIAAAVDYALPIPVALAVGAEVGFAMLLDTYDTADFKCLPVFARVSWHPNFEVKNLDPYVTLKLGYNFLLTGAEGPG
jgi:hypothetical protein